MHVIRAHYARALLIWLENLELYRNIHSGDIFAPVIERCDFLFILYSARSMKPFFSSAWHDFIEICSDIMMHLIHRAVQPELYVRAVDLSTTDGWAVRLRALFGRKGAKVQRELKINNVK